MKRNTWISLIVVAVIFGGGGYYFGSQSASTAATTSTAAGASAYAGRAGNFAGRAGAFGGAGGNATIGTIIATTNGSFTVQLPTSTSTTATTGTKIVLFDDSTAVSELVSVPATSLAVGQSVTVTGTTNADGSVTATSIMARSANAGGRSGTSPTAAQ